VDLSSYSDLYYRWEHEQWSAGEIDFTEDRRQWDAEVSEGLRRSLLWQLASFYVADEQVTDALVPYVDAAPTEEQQVFLSTQLVDAARHLVFFDRFFSEVLGEEGDMSSRLSAQPGRLNAGAKTLLLGLLPDAGRKIRSDGDRLDSLIEGIALYHLVIEGTVATTTQRSLVAFLNESGLLPGLREGFTAIARDMTRHVGFGLRFLKEMVDNDRHFADVIRSTLIGNPVGWSVMDPPQGDMTYFDPLPYGPNDLTSAAQSELEYNLRVIGVDLAA
jgi:ribonucleoside-diphosphate reductase beta chain